MIRLLLAEHDYQVRNFLSRGVDETDRWIALGPSAMACLEDLGIAYQIPEDFYSAAEFGEFCKQTHSLTESVCDHLDGIVRKLHPELDSMGMAPFRFWIVPLFQIFDAVRGRVFQLEKIFSANPAATIHMHKGRRLPWNSDDLLFSNRETLWAEVASLSGWDRQIELLPDPASSDAPARSNVAAPANSFNLKKRVLQSLWLTSLARLGMLRNYRGMVNLMRRRSSALLLVGAPYEWAGVLPILSREGRRILFTSKEYFEIDAAESTGSEANFKQLESDHDLMSCFRVGPINYFPLLRERLSWIWHTSPAQFAAVARKVAQLCRRHRISGVLRCSSSSGIDHAINQSARALGIPVFAWQHGAVSHDTKITQFRDYADAMTSDYTFVYGTEVEKAYTQFGKRFSSTVAPVGTTSLDSMISSAPESRAARLASGRDRKTIVYATTNYMQNHWYGGWQPVFSDREHFRDQVLITECLSQAAQKGLAEIVIKLHPNPEYQEPPWVAKLRNVKSVRIVKDEESFENLVRHSDGVVLDFPSTTLLQSIAMGVPVFVLIQRWPFPAAAQAQLRQRAVAVNSAAELGANLESFLESGAYPADPAHTAFLEGFGTHLNDGKTAQRVIAILSEVMEKGVSRVGLANGRPALAGDSPGELGLRH